MGLGKTLQAIAVACVYREDWPLLIITPSSLKFSWIEELEKWLTNIVPTDINLVHSGADARYLIFDIHSLRLLNTYTVKPGYASNFVHVLYCQLWFH